MSQEIADAPNIVLILADNLQAAPVRRTAPFVDKPNVAAQKDYFTHVHLRHEVRAGKYKIRDFDFRTKPDTEMANEDTKGLPEELKYEVFDYAPGASIIQDALDKKDVADDRGGSRWDEGELKQRAQRYLDAERTARAGFGCCGFGESGHRSADDDAQHLHGCCERPAAAA